MSKTKLKVKVDIEFEIELSTKRKTCTSCNGAGQIVVDDPDIKKDSCDDCSFSGDFYTQINNAILGQGNEYGLKKYLSAHDLSKIQFLKEIILRRERFWTEHEEQAYADTPKFANVQRVN